VCAGHLSQRPRQRSRCEAGHISRRPAGQGAPTAGAVVTHSSCPSQPARRAGSRSWPIRSTRRAKIAASATFAMKSDRDAALRVCGGAPRRRSEKVLGSCSRRTAAQTTFARSSLALVTPNAPKLKLRQLLQHFRSTGDNNHSPHRPRAQAAPEDTRSRFEGLIRALDPCLRMSGSRRRHGCGEPRPSLQVPPRINGTPGRKRAAMPLSAAHQPGAGRPAQGKAGELPGTGKRLRSACSTAPPVAARTHGGRAQEGLKKRLRHAPVARPPGQWWDAWCRKRALRAIPAYQPNWHAKQGLNALPPGRSPADSSADVSSHASGSQMPGCRPTSTRQRRSGEHPSPPG